MKGYVKFLTAPPHVNSNLFFFFSSSKGRRPFFVDRKNIEENAPTKKDEFESANPG